MRAFLFFVPAVLSCEINFYTDELCSAASTGEIKYKTTRVGSSGPVEEDDVFKHEGPLAWIPGTCLALSPSFKKSLKEGANDAVAIEYVATFGLMGQGNSLADGFLYAKDNAECKFTDKAKDEKQNAAPAGMIQLTYDRSRITSLVGGLGALGQGAAANVCEPLYGAGSAAASVKYKDGAKKGFYRFTTCGPVPAAVWGIILGSLGIVLSFAGLGLAAAAGK